MTPEPTPVGGMTPRLPVSFAPVTRILTTAGLTLVATAMVADDSSMATGWRAPALVDWGVGHRGDRSIESAGRVERKDRATRRQDRGQQRGGEQRPAAPAIATGRAGRHGRRGGRRRGLVPALGGHGWRVIPGACPIGARLRGGRVAVAGRGPGAGDAFGVGRRVRRHGVDRADGRARIDRGGRVDRRHGVALGQIRWVGGVGVGFVMHGAGRCLGWVRPVSGRGWKA